MAKTPKTPTTRGATAPDLTLVSPASPTKTSAEERAGAAAFRRLFKRISDISDATCGDDEDVDGRDYPAMEAQLRATLAQQLAADGPSLRGFLRALTHLLALNADGAGIGPADDWDPIAATARAYGKKADAEADVGLCSSPTANRLTSVAEAMERFSDSAQTLELQALGHRIGHGTMQLQDRLAHMHEALGVIVQTLEALGSESNGVRALASMAEAYARATCDIAFDLHGLTMAAVERAGLELERQPDAAADEQTAAHSKPRTPPSGADDWQNLIEDIAKYVHLGDAELLADLAGDALSYAGFSSTGSERARRFLHGMGQTLASPPSNTTGQPAAGPAQDGDADRAQAMDAAWELHEVVEMLLEQVEGPTYDSPEAAAICFRVRGLSRRMEQLSSTLMAAVCDTEPGVQP